MPVFVQGWTKGSKNRHKGKVIYKREHAFSLGAFGLTFVGVLIILELVRYIDTGQPSLQLVLLSPIVGSIILSLFFALIIGSVWGQIWLEWGALRISEGADYLYLEFDISGGDAYMAQLLDEIGLPVEGV